MLICYNSTRSIPYSFTLLNIIFSITMSKRFFSKSSQNYIELLEDNEYYDVSIEIGEDPNVKIFRAHMNKYFVLLFSVFTGDFGFE